MKLKVFITCCFLGPFLIYGETSVWTRIEYLSQFDAPQGNPQLENYLQTLTHLQMLDAARECCSKATTRVPQEKWEEGVIPVGIALAFYGNREGGLSGDSLRRLLDCIASEHEGELFRETLVRVVRQRYWEQMTDAQRRQSRQSFLEVASDKNAPERLRVLSCRELTQALAENHRRVIVSDKNVRPLRSDRQKWQNVNSLVRSGEVCLDPATHDALKVLTDEIMGVTPVLSALSDDDTESSAVRAQAASALRQLAELPIPSKH